MKIDQHPPKFKKKSIQINQNEPQNAPRASKILPELFKIINFLLHSKGVAGVAAGVVNPATPWGRVKTHGIGILSLYLASTAPAHSAGRVDSTDAAAPLDLKIDQNRSSMSSAAPF